MDVKSLLIKIGADTASMEAGFKKADGLIAGNAEKFKKAGRTMTIAGGAILGIVGGLVKAYANFDNKLTESTAIMGDISDAMRTRMAEAAKDMSEESTFAAEKLAGAYFFLASAGMDAEQSIAALPIVTKFAQAGAFDLALATDLLTDAQSALGLSSKDAAENQENMLLISDALVMANTLANASVSQFSEALTNKAGPAMRAYDVSLEEGVAVLAAFADQGIKGRQAGEKYSIVLRDLQKATMENKGAFEEAGIAVYDANGNLNNMGDIVGQLEARFEGMSAEQKKSELVMLGFQEESQSVLLTLVGTSAKIKQYEKDLKSAGGITEKVSQKQLKSLTNQFIMAKNSIVNTAISLGETLGPVMIEIAEKIKETVKKIRDWVKEHPELTKGIALTAAKLGLLLAILGPLVMVLPKIAAGLKLVKVAFIALQSPVGLIGIAILAVVVSLKDMMKTMEDAKKAMTDFAAESEVFQDAAENFRTLWITVRKEGGVTLDLFNELMTRFGGNWDAIMKTIIKDPKFATLKALLLDIASGVTKVDLAGQELSITLPASFQKAGKGAGELVKQVFAANEEIIGLVRTMTDEIMKCGEDEYQTAKRHLADKLTDRIATIGAIEAAEGASAAEIEDLEKQKNTAIATARESHLKELETLDKDHATALKTIRDTAMETYRGDMKTLYAFLKEEQTKYNDEAAAAEENFLSLKQDTVNAIMGMEMGRWDFAREMLLQEEEARTNAIEKLLIAERKKEELIAALQYEMYLKRKELEELEDEEREISFENLLAMTAGVLNDLGSLFSMAYQNRMLEIDNEEIRRLEAIDNMYSAEIEAMEGILEAEQLKTEGILDIERTKTEELQAAEEKRTADTLAAITSEYEAKRQHIMDNVKDEGKRDKRLADLEKQYENRLEQARTDRAAAEEDVRINREAAEEQVRLDREIAEQEAADALEAIEEAKRAAIEAAELELEGKRTAARRSAAKQEKAVAIMSAIVGTAAGVAQMLKLPWPFNLVMAGIVGAMGAVKVGLIKSTPIPLAEGGIVMSRTVAEIGEAGPEAVIPLNKLGGGLQPAPVYVKQSNYFYGDINNAGDIDEISDRLAKRMTRQLERGRRS